MTARRTHVVVATATTASMMAMPFVRRGGRTRRHLSSAIVTGLLATTTTASGARWGRCRTISAVVTTSSVTAAIEAVGVRAGRPFGRYAYTGALRPQLLGVPVVVPMAWSAMAVPARETAHAALGRRSSPVSRIVLGAAALTAWDLFLDPQMVGEGFWRWARPGGYRGIPLVNFAGWFATGLVVMALLEFTLPPGAPSPELVAQYGVMGVLETAAFSTFLGDRVVAVAGGAAMLPVAAVAAAGLVGHRP